MSNLVKDILIGIVFLTGLVNFISGEFIISSTLFLIATVAGYIKRQPYDDRTRYFS
jgi:hypothetical protein